MIVIGSRKSKLAMWQTEMVAEALNAAGMLPDILAALDLFRNPLRMTATLRS